MADAKDLVEAEAFAVLAAGISGATVYQDAPDNAPFPLVVLGDSRSTEMGGKDGDDERVELDIVTMISAEEKAPLTALQGQIKQLLRRHRVDRDGRRLLFRFESDNAGLHESGNSYVGTTTLSVIALKI